MKKILHIGMFLCCFAGHVEAQKVDNELLIDSIKADVTRFFIKENLLDKHKVKENLNYVFVTEIKQKRAVGYDLNGIYRIGVYQSHSPEHILIKQNNEFRLFDLKKIDTVLTEVIDYSKKNNITTDIMLLYVTAIIDMYNESYKNNQGGGKLKKQEL
jgi:hypothetical protein